MTFARETQHTARKPYRCQGCDRRIEAGERYTRYAGIYEDGFATGAYHSDCREWEIKLCRAADLWDDEWQCLSDFVEEDGPIVLDGAPEAVRARFGLASVPVTPDAGLAASPCTGLCGLDDAGLCRGCGRTAGEIAAWRGMDDAGKRRVLARIAGRGVGSGCTQGSAPGATRGAP